jgi:hypothetical protein
MRYSFWLLYGLFVLALFARLLPVAWKEPAVPTPCFRFPHPILMIAPLLVFLNGLAPHVGFKTTHSFAMYSNLRTEDGTSNHYLFPAWLQVFDYGSDLVTIEWSTDPMLNDLSRPGWRGHRQTQLLGTYILRADQLFERYTEPPSWKLPYVSMKQRIRYLADHGVKNIGVVYVRDGEKRTVMQAEEDPELTDVAFWETKLFRLRAVPDIEEGCCMW